MPDDELAHVHVAHISRLGSHRLLVEAFNVADVPLLVPSVNFFYDNASK